MTRKMSKPITKEFEVEDPEGNWHVSFRQLTEGDYIEIGDLEGRRDDLFDDQGNWIGRRQVSNRRRSERRGIYRTMISCDLAWEDDTLIFDAREGSVAKAMTEKQFNTRWDELANEVASAIVSKFEEMNPTLVGE